MIKEFKEFIVQGNALDLAIGVVIGGAFSSIVSKTCRRVYHTTC